jgi:hypothetical protein
VPALLTLSFRCQDRSTDYQAFHNTSGLLGLSFLQCNLDGVTVALRYKNQIKAYRFVRPTPKPRAQLALAKPERYGVVPAGVNSSHIRSGICTGAPRAARRYFAHASATGVCAMKVRQISLSDLLADEKKLVPWFYDLLASVDDEELHEIFHDFMVPANDSDQTPGSSTPRGLPRKTPSRRRGL